jgi:hypothetical protein
MDLKDTYNIIELFLMIREKKKHHGKKIESVDIMQMVEWVGIYISSGK